MDPASDLQAAVLQDAALPGYSLQATGATAGALRRASARGVALTFGSQGARVVLQFSAQLVLAHWLLPAEFGLVAMVAPVLSLVQVFNDLGLTQATVQREQISHPELSAMFWINLGVSTILASALAAAAPLIAWFYHEPKLIPITLACASLLILSGAAAQQIALMNRRMRYGALASIDVSCAAMAFATGLATAAAGWGYWSLVAMQAANSLTILALAWGLSQWRPSLPTSGTSVWPLLRFGGHLTGFNLLGYVENNLGTILIGRISGVAALGLYDRAFKLVIVPWWQISLPLDRVAVSLLSRLQSDPAEYAHAFRQMLQTLLLAASPGLLWAAMDADLLIPLVLGPSWHGAAPIVAWLAAAAILLPFGAASYWLFVSQARVNIQLRYGMLSAALLVSSILIGVQSGPLGVAQAYAGFTPMIQGVLLWGATRAGPVDLRQIGRAVVPIGFGLLAALAALVYLKTIPGLPAMFVALAASYGLTYSALLCLPSGRRIIRDAVQLRHMLHRDQS